jgi:2,4-dienoyl-CoA reductase-like NADH-dependent reductase (Old Yellow Enzyme family)
MELNSSQCSAPKRETGVGGITDRVTMEEIVEKGHGNFISPCRALVGDPAFPEKIRSGNREPSIYVELI